MNKVVAEQERNELVAKKIAEWQAELDRRISEITPAQTVELSAAHPTGLAQLYAGRPTRLSNLVREPRALSQCRIRARALMKATTEMEARYGIAPIFLAVGSASWQSPTDNTTDRYKIEELDTQEVSELEENPIFDHEKEITSDQDRLAYRKSPALLYGLELSVSEDEDIVIKLNQNIQLSPELEKALSAHGEKVRLQKILKEACDSGHFAPDQPLSEITALGQEYLDDFKLYNSITVGQYLHPLDLLREEINGAVAKLKGSSLVAAVAGDVPTVLAMNNGLPEFLPTDRDPNMEHGIGDLDPTQHNILDSVAYGANLVLDAPPGAEVRATVAAILADSVACGKTVSYISWEKRKASSLVHYFQELGLSDLVLDLTSPNAWGAESRQKLARVIRHAINYESRGVTSQTQKMRDELIQVRNQFGGYMEQLHAKRAPWGISAYDALQVLADLTALKPGPKTRVRFDIDTLHKIASDGAVSAQKVIEEAEAAGIFKETRATNPWHGVVLRSEEQVPETIAAVKRIATEYLPKVREQMERAVREVGLNPANTLEEWRNQLQMLDGVRNVLDTFKAEIFENSAADMVIATAPKRWRQARALNMRDSARRRLVKKAKSLVRPGRRVEDLHRELIKVQQQRQIWREYSDGGGWPMIPNNLSQMWETEKALRAELTQLQPFFSTGYGNLFKAPVDDVATLMKTLATDYQGAQKLPQRVSILKRIRELGLETLVDDIRERRVPSELVKLELDLAWWASALAEILQLDDRLSKYSGAHLKMLAQRLRKLDYQQVQSLPEQLKDEVFMRMSEVVNHHLEEVERVLALLDEGTVELSTLFQQFGWLLAVCPIRIIPAVQISKMLAPDGAVDILVLDGLDHSEIPELMLPLSYSEQVVVVGDTKRRQEGTVYAFSKLFPVLNLPQSRVRTNEWVAGFLASHNFGQELLPIPLPRSSTAVSLRIVDGRGMPAPGVQAIESSAEEVRAVVELVSEYARNAPEESLAVVALNERHRQRIAEAILGAVASSPTLDQFVNDRKNEPFIVLSSANCNGIRRDNVILSLGFAKTPHGRVLHDFGAISTDGGDTHLVDALSVVRKELTVVSSMQASELDQSRLRTPGAKLLYDLLEQAESGESGAVLAPSLETESEEQPPDRLLIDLAERLYSIGLTVIPNLGSRSGIQIPLAIGHPDYPDELLLAVMTDNEDFVAEKSLRRRERHWLERLEDQGWKVAMVYSTAAFMDPQEQAKEILNLVLDVVEERQREVPEEELVPVAEEFPAAQIEEGGEKVEEDNPTENTSSSRVPVLREESVTTMAGDDELEEMSLEEKRIAEILETQDLRPPLAKGLPLSAYSDDQLDELLIWIRSDGRDRKPAEELERLYDELSLPHRGEQTDAVLLNVVKRNLK